MQAVDGLRPIETVAVGDLVLARDEVTGETALRPVTELVRGQPREIWDIVIEVTGLNGESRRETFGATEDHPWRTVGGDWAESAELYPGLELVTADGARAVVVSATPTDRIEATYNFEVEGFHTYFIGEAGLWVHNACWGPGSFPSVAESVIHHFGKHGAEVGARSAAEYARMAIRFSRNLRGLRSTGLRPDGSIRYTGRGHYIIMREGRIVSFGIR